MALNKRHELHTRRYSRNLGVGLVLGALMAIIFGLTIVKIERGDFQVNPAIQGATDGN